MHQKLLPHASSGEDGTVMVSRGPTLALLAAGSLLLTIWLLLPASSPPLYDGLILPPEPYRYLHPTAREAQENLPPLSKVAHIPVQNGLVAMRVVHTGEKPPQVEV